ncbi:HAD family hydrolase [Amycolatopsis rubida]|uniref:HAD family hydrolase n=1 Tax=Amycolatopsis rubida TaxID=112413 RepID=A0ABX0BJU1_9PSEU|nr:MULTISPECIES: HAD hydrolase-like protein [Amycolatopsis]MYW89334.1 HAD hydrolase-like protein [Amycolatopsis rubida]NEC54312.1 HAD family hydrolase [Amycolatopsis rubida]OAP21083.1 Phosphoglycolate phosphatase [Amycolatopsis sp. M39]
MAAPTRPVRAVLFDLDGTLVQTRTASWEIFSRINDRFDLGVDSPQRYYELFQGNVFESIRRICRNQAHAAAVTDAFLALLREDYAPPLVPGVSDVVRTLAGHCTLAVMSSNAMQVLRRVLTDNGLAYCFAHVFGGDVAPDKRTAITSFLADAGSGFGRRCSADYDETGKVLPPDPAATVLVTDTAGDVRDALAAGIRAVGVAWGMHGVEELTAAGAEFVALWPQELSAHLLGDAAAAGPVGACALPATTAAPARPGGCGCGCDGKDQTQPSVAARRQRRRTAVASLAAPAPISSAVPDELLAAIVRVCEGA